MLTSTLPCPSPLPLPLGATLLLFVTVAACNDLARRRIPNQLVLAGLGTALALQWLVGAGLPWRWLAGAATGLAVFLPLYLLRGMAAGDVKLMAMVGAFAGPALVIQICLASCLAGGVMALALVLYRGQGSQALARLRYGLLLALQRLGLVDGALLRGVAAPASVGGMPYGLAIAAGTVLLLLVQHD